MNIVRRNMNSHVLMGPRTCCGQVVSRNSARRSRSAALPRKLSAPRFVTKAEDKADGTRALAPVKVKTSMGKLLHYYLTMEPHLLPGLIEQQLEHLQEEKENDRNKGDKAPDPPGRAAEEDNNLVLYRRMDEVRQRERRASLEELMYICVLEKFLSLGVQMLPRVDLQTESLGGSIKALTEGIHSQEALEMVKQQVRLIMGQATLAPDAALVKMPKLQAVQMYVTSIMFGYFLRRVDNRFQLERSAGSFAESEAKEEAVNRLERLFAQADSLDLSSSPDSASASTLSDEDQRADAERSDAESQSSSSGSGQQTSKQGALRQYIDGFGPETVQEMARVVSQEAATIIEMQSVALFGDYRVLQTQMEKAIGSNFISIEDLMERVKKGMDSGEIETLALTVDTQKRAILEAIAFGTFLRDVESHIDSRHGLLTAAQGGDSGGRGGGPSGLAAGL